MEKFKFETGDIGFLVGDKWTSNLISWVTGGPFCHVFLVYNDKKIFETDGAWFKAKFSDVSKYDELNRIVVFRFKGLSDERKKRIQEVANKYIGIPYSYWDCALNLLVAPLNERIREWTTEKLGSKRFMKCDELIMTVIFEALGYAPFKHDESFEPNALYKLCLEVQEDFIIFDRRKDKND